MGDYIVNGEVISVREERPTAQTLKAAAGSTPTDWVMASMPSGEMVQVHDDALLPNDATRYSIVPKFRYGGPTE